MKFKTHILETLKGEPIEAIAIGKFGWDGYHERDRKIPDEKIGVLLTLDEALPLLDYEYNDGFGAPDCHAVYIWTKERVYWVTQYDGSTSLDSVPRNPVDVIPDMPGTYMPGT